MWERIKGRHEPDIKILRRVNSRIGLRYLVEGLESGRQWHVSPVTLMNSYRPKPD